MVARQTYLRVLPPYALGYYENVASRQSANFAEFATALRKFQVLWPRDNKPHIADLPLVTIQPWSNLFKVQTRSHKSTIKICIQSINQSIEGSFDKSRWLRECDAGYLAARAYCNLESVVYWNRFHSLAQRSQVDYGYKAEYWAIWRELFFQIRRSSSNTVSLSISSERAL
jgi:hypothetical protein